jgi:hypothetical protein
MGIFGLFMLFHQEKRKNSRENFHSMAATNTLKKIAFDSLKKKLSSSLNNAFEINIKVKQETATKKN